VAPIDDELRQKYPEVGFFEQKNPGHLQGDELCCLGLIHPHQWFYYLSKLGKKRLATLQRVLWGLNSGSKFLPSAVALSRDCHDVESHDSSTLVLASSPESKNERGSSRMMPAGAL
jgi:hypothetical protein